MEDFSEILDEIQKYGKFETVASLADKIKVSAAQLSRIKNKNSPLSDETVEKICSYFKNDADYAEKLRVRLKKIQSSFFDTKWYREVGESSEKFYDKFFNTQQNEKRIICVTYRDIPQSRKGGATPEDILESVNIIKNSGLVCGFFQCFGPIKEITENLKDAADRNDTDATKTWSYIQALALDVHEIFQEHKEKLREMSGKVVLYEAKKVPPLVYCDIHSRLFYSEKLTPLTDEDKIHGKGRIRIVQLIMGRDENNVDKEYYIECNTDAAFQAVISTQFYPVLHYWRATNGELPVDEGKLKKFVNSLSGGHKYIPWNIYT